MKIKEKSKVDFNSICFSFQIHTRYRRVDTGSSVYKKIFTPKTVTFYCAHRMSAQIKVIAKIKLRHKRGLKRFFLGPPFETL